MFEEEKKEKEGKERSRKSNGGEWLKRPLHLGGSTGFSLEAATRSPMQHRYPPLLPLSLLWSTLSRKLVTGNHHSAPNINFYCSRITSSPSTHNPFIPSNSHIIIIIIIRLAIEPLALLLSPAKSLQTLSIESPRRLCE